MSDYDCIRSRWLQKHNVVDRQVGCLSILPYFPFIVQHQRILNMIIWCRKKLVQRA